MCSIHVASVVQMTHMILCHGGVLQCGAMNSHQHVASIWSAVMHDFEHGGVNNDFLIKTSSPLAILYNDQSPLENHHLAASTKLFTQDKYRFLPVSFQICLVFRLQHVASCTTPLLHAAQLVCSVPAGIHSLYSMSRLLRVCIFTMPGVSHFGDLCGIFLVQHVGTCNYQHIDTAIHNICRYFQNCQEASCKHHKL